MKVLGIIGTNFGSKTKIALNTIKFHSDINYEIIDLSLYTLPFADGRVLLDYDKETVNLINKIMDADALIIGSPIYQASIPGILKNLFDLLPQYAIRNKVVGFVLTAGSKHHYMVGEYTLIPILNYLKASVINKYVFITSDDYDFDKINNDGIMIRLEQLVETIIERYSFIKEKNDKYDF